MIIELDETLRLSKLRKILQLMGSGKTIKINNDGTCYDISKVVDKKDKTIFEVKDFDGYFHINRSEK